MEWPGSTTSATTIGATVATACTNQPSGPARAISMEPGDDGSRRSTIPHQGMTVQAGHTTPPKCGSNTVEGKTT
eukprot:11940397-Prorocentrum_lima.AAC.1